MSWKEARLVTLELLSGDLSEEEISQVLIRWNEVGFGRGAILGVYDALSERMKPIQLLSQPSFDICGTGGDDLHTFNISTGTAIMLAAAGISVCKLGGGAQSSPSGATDVLRALGVTTDLWPQAISMCYARTGFGFIPAEEYHSGLFRINAARKRLGAPTIFNLVLPLLHPGKPQRRMLGVARRYYKHLAVLSEIFATENMVCLAITGEDGADEVSVSSGTVTQWLGSRGTEYSKATIFPADPEIDLPVWSANHLVVTSPEESARMIRDVFSGQNTGAPRDSLLLNTAVAAAFIRTTPISVGLKEARATIESGAALAKLEELVSTTRDLAKR